MKNTFLFLGRNTVPTIVISIITLVVFSTSIYGFVKAADMNAPTGNIPEVKTIEQETAENMVSTSGSAPADQEQDVLTASSEFSESSSIVIQQNNPSPTPSASSVVNQQDNSTSPTSSAGQQSNPVQNQEDLQGTQAIIENSSGVEIDDDLEDVHEDDEDDDNDDDDDNDNNEDEDSGEDEDSSEDD